MQTISFSKLFYTISIFLLFFSSSCSKDDEIGSYELTQEQKALQNIVPEITIIAHRGTCYWAPEGTEAAMRWARNAGATYLECDIQRSKDGYLVVFHDDDLTRTSNVSEIYPDRKNSPISEFTLEELFSLNIGAWFNKAEPTNSRMAFNHLDILTLEDVIKIAEGFKIQRDNQHKRIYKKENGRIHTLYEKDPAENGHRPGIYPEIKRADLYPNIEYDLKKELVRLGWYSQNISSLKKIQTFPGKIQIANSPARVIVQTFSEKSLTKLNNVFSRPIPFCFLISTPNNEEVSEDTYNYWINYAIKNGAVIIGPCIYEKNGLLGNLLKPWMIDMIKEKGLLIHAYTFKSLEQIIENQDIVDGFFTNQTDILLSLLSKSGKKLSNPPQEELPGYIILDRLGY